MDAGLANLTLNDWIAKWEAMPESEKEAAYLAALKDNGNLDWLPNPGPQTAAYMSEADELFYGGEAGGGKTDLLLGTALNCHRRARIFRRMNAEVDALVDRMIGIVGTAGIKRNPPANYRTAKQIIHFSGIQHEDDWTKYQGNAQDMFGFDELTNFTRKQYTTLIAWNRSTIPGQRSRVISTGNPPTTPEGMWVIQYWAPWLDPEHPNPALPGELRWFTTINGVDTEVENYEGGPVMIDGHPLLDEKGKPIYPKSRTFIPAQLADNPDLEETGYGSRLAALPAELRSSLKEGRFQAQLADSPLQVFPTAHVEAAMARWNPIGTNGPMTTIGIDVAQGGEANTALCPRHGSFFDKLTVVKGKDTPDGPAVASLFTALRRGNATAAIDMGGGYGISTRDHLKGMVEVEEFNGSAPIALRDRSGMLKFKNTRTAAHWHLRELLDPITGSNVALPPDPLLKEELLAVRYSITQGGIEIEPKKNVMARIGRTPDRMDCVIIAAFATGSTNPATFANSSLQTQATVSGRNPRRR